MSSYHNMMAVSSSSVESSLQGAHRSFSNRSPKHNQSSKYLQKQKREVQHRTNPCNDDQAFHVLSESLETEKVGVLKLFRFATWFDFLLMGVGTFFATAAAIFSVLSVRVYGSTYRLILETQNFCFSEKNWYSHDALMAAMFVLSVLIYGMCFQISAERQIKHLRLTYMHALVSKDWSWFDIYKDRGLAMRFNSDATEIRIAVGESLPKLIYCTLSCFMMTVTSLLENVWLAAVVLIAVPLLAVSAYVKSNADKKLKKKDSELYENANQLSADLLVRIKTIKLFGGEEKAVKSYRALLYSPLSVCGTVLLTAFLSGLTWFIPLCLYGLFCFVAISLENKIVNLSGYSYRNFTSCTRGAINWSLVETPLFSKLDTILLYMIFVSYFISFIPTLRKRITSAQYVAAEIFFVIDKNPSIDNLLEIGSVPKQHLFGKLKMSDVSFAYPLRPNREILHKVNLFAYPGQIVAIFGPPKSGKSTILSLLHRTCDPCRGTIQWDDEDIVNYSVPWLRSQFGVVHENPKLLNGTVVDNICDYQDPDLNHLDDVCRKANVLNDIYRLNQGFDTVVGSISPVKLSKNWIKKIRLARALYRHCRVFLLDDFFIDLEENDENHIRQYFESQREKITVIFTCRKMNPMLKTSDIVFVVKDGRVVEFGNHEVLLKNDGAYTKLLEETIHDFESAAKPKVDSQLAYYKFGAAIKRMHDIHDIGDRIDYNLLWENKLPVDSLLLRHCVGASRKFIHPRLVGGFFRFANFEYAHEKDIGKIIGSNLLRERDLRSKIFPNVWTPLRPAFNVIPSTVQNKDGEFIPISELLLAKSPRFDVPDRPVTMDAPSLNFETLINLRVLATKIRSSKKAKGQAVKAAAKPGFLQVPGSVGKKLSQLSKQSKMSQVSQGKKMQPPRGKSSSGGMKWHKLRMHYAPSIKLENDGSLLRHYFGLTINSEADSVSIASEDSYNFWDEYSDRLQFNIVRKHISYARIFTLAKYSYPYLLFSFVTGSVLGFILCFSAEEYAALAEKYVRSVPDKAGVTHHSIVLCGAAFVALGVSFLQEIVLGFGNLRANNTFRSRFFGFLLEQELGWFDEPRHDVSILCDHLVADVPTVNTAFLALISMGSEAIMIFTGLGWALMWFDQLWPEQACLILVILLAVFPCYLESRYQSTYRRRSISLHQKATEVASDVVNNAFEVISMGLSKQLLERFKLFLNVDKFSIFHLMARNTVLALSEAVFFICYTVYKDINEGKLMYHQEQIESYLFLAFLVIYGFMPMGYALATVPTFTDIAESAACIVEAESYALMKTKIRKRSLEVHTLGAAPRIRIQDVRFAFGNSAYYVLRGVTFEIPAKSYTAIVGTARSGKSTLIALLQRMYNPLKGRIYFDEINYTELNEKHLRQAITVVEQDPDLFLNATIEENIAYGDNTRSVRSQEVVAAAKLANIHDDVESLPDTYRTKVGDLPPGPDTFALRQRIAVARAAVRDAKVVIVDQATISTSKPNTFLLFNALMNLRKGKTFIVASQRVQPIRGADVIVVLKNGRVAEIGDDTQLLRSKGVYYELLMSQRLYERQESFDVPGFE